MLGNYLKIAVRNLWRQRFYSLINIAGLAVGMATCLMIAQFAIGQRDENAVVLFPGQQR